MIPDINTTCKYVFTTAFSKLNGIYTLTKKQSFDTALASDVDFTTSLYEPAGLTEDRYNSEWSNYQNDTILELVQVNVEDGATALTIHAPTSIIDLVPDPMVKEYHDLYIAITLGYLDNPTKIAWIIEELREIASSVTGTTDEVNIYSTDTQWLTDAEYQALDDERQARIKQITPLAVTLKQCREENARLKELILKYEDTIKALSA